MNFTNWFYVQILKFFEKLWPSYPQI